MRRPGQKRKRNSFLITAFLACLFFMGMEAWAARQMVYKAPRGLKDTSLALGRSVGSSSNQEVNKSSERTDPFKSFLSLQEEANQKKKK
ncbi:MAG: hypothetical protein DRN37_11880, partial [Thermoplasmata archaeon]